MHTYIHPGCSPTIPTIPIRIQQPRFVVVVVGYKLVPVPRLSPSRVLEIDKGHLQTARELGEPEGHVVPVTKEDSGTVISMGHFHWK